MTLEELSCQYRETADTIYGKVRQLRRLQEQAGPGESREIARRIRIMLRMYRDTRQIAVHLKKYYDRSHARDDRYRI